MSETVIFLHGWGGSKQSLTPLAKKFKEDGDRVLTLEMPGHGDTAKMDSAWDMSEFANWALSEISANKLEISKAILIGHSFGGKIILELLTHKNINPKAVVLIDANGIKPKNSFKKAVFKLLARLLKPLSRFKPIRHFVYKFIVRERDYLNSTGMLKESFKLFNEQHYNDKLNSINSKTLIIWGKDDKVTPLWMGEALNLGIKGSRFVVLEGTHGLPLKNPDSIFKLVKEFLEND